MTTIAELSRQVRQIRKDLDQVRNLDVIKVLLGRLAAKSKQPKAVLSIVPKAKASSKPSTGLTEGQIEYRRKVAKLLQAKLGKDVDIQWNVNVLTAQKWAAAGRHVTKGQTSSQGVFHILQTQAVA